ncbi:MAG: two-component system response regulator [Nitrospira bacterium HGW-Nitrospira-1]|nr:MAG: two-component system response regulator [Nitrospira bacterium HGW-Nitrospira-1]
MTAEVFRILVVDDDRYILEFVTELLKDNGYEVYPLIDASGAIDIIREKDMDIILSDIKMPGISGIELLERVYGMNPDLPVILMTAYAELPLVIDAIKNRAFDFIAKPFKPEQLINAMEKAVRHVRRVRLEKRYKDTLEDNVRQRTKELNDSYMELEDLYNNLILAFVNAIDAKSRWTKGHSERVSRYAVSIAKEMGLDKKEIEDLRIAALLHDIGKIGTYDVVLNKPDKLTADEVALIKTHPVKGEEILRPIKQLRHILPAIRSHHEKMDGSGYPDRLKGDNIPLLAKILCVADSVDAIISDRPYRPAYGREYSVSELKKCNGTQFDPEVVKAFIKITEEEGSATALPR